jgi:hypothetical protein
LDRVKGELRMSDLEHLYHTKRWQRVRARQLAESPLCKYCFEGRGLVTPATVCDHVTPHKNDLLNFWAGPFQSLCANCHQSTKRHVELHGFRPDIGLDGYPIDKANHPFFRQVKNKAPG